MIKAVFFDLDGTLYDFFDAAQAALRSVSQGLQSGGAGGPLGVSGFSDAFWRGYYRLMECSRGRCLDPRTALPGLMASALRESGMRNRSSAPGICLTLAERWVQGFLSAVRPFEGVKELLSGLCARGVQIGVISNGARDFQKLKLETLGLISYFKDQSLIFSEEIGSGKPDPEIFRAALGSCGLRAEEVLFVGDSPVTDVPGAVKAGFQVIWLNRYGLPAPVGHREVPQARCFSEASEMIWAIK